MRQGFKIILAGTFTWVAAVYSYDAISYDFVSPWSFDRDEGAVDGFLALCVLPPIVVLIGFRLFTWALGDELLPVVTRNKSNLFAALLLILLSIAVFNSEKAAINSDNAYSAAQDALGAARNAESAARYAASNASEAESSASVAALNCAIHR